MRINKRHLVYRANDRHVTLVSQKTGWPDGKKSSNGLDFYVYGNENEKQKLYYDVNVRTAMYIYFDKSGHIEPYFKDGDKEVTFDSVSDFYGKKGMNYEGTIDMGNIDYDGSGKTHNPTHWVFSSGLKEITPVDDETPIPKRVFQVGSDDKLYASGVSNPKEFMDQPHEDTYFQNMANECKCEVFFLKKGEHVKHFSPQPPTTPNKDDVPRPQRLAGPYRGVRARVA